MTVNQIIELLQAIADDGFGEREIRLAYQPSWPLQFEVRDVRARGSSRGVEHPVYITEGLHPDDSPYAPAWVFGDDEDEEDEEEEHQS